MVGNEGCQAVGLDGIMSTHPSYHENDSQEHAYECAHFGDHLPVSFLKSYEMIFNCHCGTVSVASDLSSNQMSLDGPNLYLFACYEERLTS